MIQHYKKSLTLIVSLFSFCYCFSQDIILNSQSAINAFDTSTTIIKGDLTIGNSPIADPIINLSNLSGLTSIGGNLIITGQNSIANLNGLNNLNSVGGYLDIRYNNSLLSLEGLNQLT
ncbi:MAG: hypothetical protein ACI9XO_002983 [Paraglaciecola sp.]|jgi:hypothetical protein